MSELEKIKRELKSARLMRLIEKDMMEDNFTMCREAAFFWKGKAEAVEKENGELKKQVENLKCCGNCFNFYQGLCCPTTNEPVNHYCEQYESDNMTREDRNDG